MLFEECLRIENCSTYSLSNNKHIKFQVQLRLCKPPAVTFFIFCHVLASVINVSSLVLTFALHIDSYLYILLEVKQHFLPLDIIVVNISPFLKSESSDCLTIWFTGKLSGLVINVVETKYWSLETSVETNFYDLSLPFLDPFCTRIYIVGFSTHGQGRKICHISTIIFTCTNFLYVHVINYGGNEKIKIFP